jgi:hypothetical protein
MKLTYSGENEFDIIEIDVEDDKATYIAKEIQKNRWRNKRASIFKKLDIDFLISIEDNNEEKKSEIASLKKQLRSVTELEMPNTPDEILNFWPDILKD